MTEYESVYKVKNQLFDLLTKQREVERDIQKYQKNYDSATVEILKKRYYDLNEEIFKTAQSFIALADD